MSSDSVSVGWKTFVDFATATALTKAKRVGEAKARQATEYDRRQDYWLPLRNEILSLHQRRRPVRELSAFLSRCAESKVANYTAAVDAYRAWAKALEIELVGQRKYVWTRGVLTVNVNPELKVMRDGKSSLVKLFFKVDRMTRAQIQVGLHLVESTVPQGTEVGVLEACAGKLHAGSGMDPGLEALLEGEAATFTRLWSLY